VVYLFFDRLGRKYLHTDEADQLLRDREREAAEVAAGGGE